MSSASIAVRLAGLAVLLPLVLNRLPAAEANLWLLFASLLALLTLLDFGFSPTFVRFIAYSRSDSTLSNTGIDPPEFVVAAREQSDAVIRTMRVVYRRLSMGMAAILAVGGSLAVTKPISQAGGDAELWVAWLIVVAGGSVRFKGLQYSAYLQGAEHIALLRRWESFIGLLTTAVASLVVWAGGGLLGLVLVTHIGAVLNAWQNRRLAIRRTSQAAWSGRAVIEPRLMSSIWPAAWRSGIGVLASAGVIQATGIAFAQIAPPAQSGAYLLALRLIDTLRLFANVPFYTSLPNMTRLYASGARADMIALARRGMILTNWLVLAGVVAVSLLANPLLALIGSETPFVPGLVWYLLGLSLLVERIGAMHLQLYSTTNHVVWHIASGVAGVIAILTIVTVAPILGVTGFALGLLAGNAGFYTPYSLLLSYRAFGLQIRDIDLPASVAPLVVMGLLLAIV